MPSETSSSPRWREKATGFFSTSGVRLKQAGQTAGTFVGDVTKDARGNVADAADRVGTAVRSRWAVIQQKRQRRDLPPPGETVQERILSAAASTGLLLKKGIAETKEKVVVGKMKVEEAAKKTADKSKGILNNIERWQKGVASSDVPLVYHAGTTIVGSPDHGSSSSVPAALDPKREKGGEVFAGLNTLVAELTVACKERPTYNEVGCDRRSNTWRAHATLTKDCCPVPCVTRFAVNVS